MRHMERTAGQIAYEEDCRRCPAYHDGTKRRTWQQLDEVSKESWERDPQPREFKE